MRAASFTSWTETHLLDQLKLCQHLVVTNLNKKAMQGTTTRYGTLV